VWVTAEGPPGVPFLWARPEDMHEWVISRLRDVWPCWMDRDGTGSGAVGVQGGTGQVQAVPAADVHRARFPAPRLQKQVGEVLGRAAPARAARHADVSWPLAHEAFTGVAGPGSESAGHAGYPPGHPRARRAVGLNGRSTRNQPSPAVSAPSGSSSPRRAALIRLARQYTADRIPRARPAFHLG
jgi:hypothetical protein